MQYAPTRPDNVPEDAWSPIKERFLAALKYFHPFELAVVDLGGLGAERAEQVRVVLDDAATRIREIIGNLEGEPHDIGRYGLIHGTHGLPPEMRVEFDCLRRDYCEALDRWQGQAVVWRAIEMLNDDIDAAAAEQQASPEKPKRATRRKAAEKPAPKRRGRRGTSEEAR